LASNCAILIIDDSVDELMLIKRAIIKYRPSCIVDVAMDGSQALLRLQNGTLPALVLLDFKLPGVDGIDILRIIRAREETRFTPVVILTSSNMDNDILAAYNAGANGYFRKTHDLILFEENIKTTIHYWLDVNMSQTGVQATVKRTDEIGNR
jgi:two-component system response regulator